MVSRHKGVQEALEEFAKKSEGFFDDANQSIIEYKAIANTNFKLGWDACENHDIEFYLRMLELSPTNMDIRLKQATVFAFLNGYAAAFTDEQTQNDSNNKDGTMTFNRIQAMTETMKIMNEI